jgi:hypothetical protein
MFVFRIPTRIRRIRMFLGLPDSQPLPLSEIPDLRIRIRSKNPTLKNAVGSGRVPLLRGLATGLRDQPGIERDGRLQPRQTGRRGRPSASQKQNFWNECREKTMKGEYSLEQGDKAFFWKASTHHTKRRRNKREERRRGGGG